MIIAPEKSGETEFGLSPSQMKGAFGNEGALPLSAISTAHLTAENAKDAELWNIFLSLLCVLCVLCGSRISAIKARSLYAE